MPQRLVLSTPLAIDRVRPAGIGVLPAARPPSSRSPASTVPYRSTLLLPSAWQDALAVSITVSIVAGTAMRLAVGMQEWRMVSPWEKPS